MKLVYAVDKSSYNNKDHVGVVKKVEAQMNLFHKNGIESTLCQYEWQGGYPQIEIEKDTDVLYFRRIEPSVKLILKLRQLKKRNPNLRLVMEIPTYPFGEEERNRISLKRKINRGIGERLLKNYIDRIVLIGQQTPIKTLYGIPVICQNNGVDFECFPVKCTSMNRNRQEGIHIVCVSGCFFWHGYDRMIEGLHNYYEQEEQEENVYLHVVGQGDCLKEYIALAEKYELLDQKVFFYGRKVGEELNAIYDVCDIAIDSLGAHRKGIFMSSSLKTREYAAKGLPMLTSTKLDIENEKTKKYILMLTADEEPIPIKKVTDFYHKVYDGKNNNSVAEQVRECFYPYCDWKFVFDDVVNYIVRGEA